MPRIDQGLEQGPVGPERLFRSPAGVAAEPEGDRQARPRTRPAPALPQSRSATATASGPGDHELTASRTTPARKEPCPDPWPTTHGQTPRVNRRRHQLKARCRRSRRSPLAESRARPLAHPDRARVDRNDLRPLVERQDVDLAPQQPVGLVDQLEGLGQVGIRPWPPSASRRSRRCRCSPGWRSSHDVVALPPDAVGVRSREAETGNGVPTI